MRIVACLVLAASACGDNLAGPDARTDAPKADAAIDANPNMPPTLADTGLCIDAGCTQVSADVHAYTPQFVLWADTASKRRWMSLPPATQIDTTDMDHWRFPQGTKFWKEFTRGGVRVETRFIFKTGPGDDTSDWFFVSYAWNAAQDATTSVPFGVTDANGTMHDIPSRAACRTCHENLDPTRILGFGAIQLDYDNTTAGELDLDDVIANGWLTTPPTGASSPHYPLPTSNAGATAALGYIHANCGHCHNPTSHVFLDNGINMVLRLDVGTLGSYATTPAYTTAVNHNAQNQIAGHTKIIVPGDPSMSIMIDRFESTNSALHMPALGSEMTDPTGDAILRTWITTP